MNAKSNFLMIMAAGAAVSSAAMAGGNDPFVMQGIPMSTVKAVRHAYFDMTTGEWSLDQRTSASRDGDFSVYNADGFAAFYFGLDDPARTTTIAKMGTEVLAWGDAENNMTVDQIVVTYVTSVLDPEEDGETGFELVNRFYDGESGAADPDAQLIAAYTISGIPGSIDGVTAAGWILTIDLGSANAFELGDNDGSDFYGNPAGLTGFDEDNDGKGDIGWSYQFNQNQTNPQAVTGPVFSFGGNMGGWYDADNDGIIDKFGGIDYPLDSAGCSSHLWGWYNSPPHGVSTGIWRFGGSPPAGATWNIQMRGPIAGDSVLDLNGDGVFDVGDLFSFLNRFDVAGG